MKVTVPVGLGPAEAFWRRVVTAVVETFVGLCVLALVGLACLQVLLRYGLGDSLVWMEDASVLILIWMVWVGGILIWIQGSHLAIDFLIQRVGRGGSRRLRLLSDAAAVIGGLALVLASVHSYHAYAGIEILSLEMDSTVKFHPIMVGTLGMVLAALHGLWCGLKGGDGR